MRTDNYKILLEGIGSSHKVSSFVHDDGHFIVDTPTTAQEKYIVEICRLLAAELSSYGKLEITLNKTD